jgi:formate hydrogenlyase subunit 3/multisubunit Na+/H+ antiporter MnhD subunit
MENTLIYSLFRVSILLFLLASTVSIMLMKREILCNALSNAICMMASLSSAVASVLYIATGAGNITIVAIQSSLSFLSVELTVDKLSAIFVLALSVLTLCVSLYSIGYSSHYIGKRKVWLFQLLYVSFILSMFLVFTSANAVFFYVSWEVMSLLSYFLVIFESEQKANQRAGTLYIIMTHIAAAFLLIAFALIYYYTQSFDLWGGSETIPDSVKNILFLLFLVGFGTKAGVIPFHIWLPYAHPAAPSNVSALMSGIMIKTGIYGLIRFVLCFLGVEQTWWGIVLLCIGVISAVLGIAYALIEENIKRLLALSSVENIGIILIGLGACFLATSKNNAFLSGLALTALLLHTVNHALFKSGLFLGAGAIQYSTHTKNMEALGGLIKKMPITAGFVLLFSLSISAVVPLNGFIGEWLTYQSLFASIAPGKALLNIVSILTIGALGLTGALVGACFVKFYGISFLGLPRSDEAKNAKEVPTSMTIGMGILATLCLMIGLFPWQMLQIIDKVVISVTSCSVAAHLEGKLLVASDSLNLFGSSISPPAILIAGALLSLLSLFVIRIIGGKYVERKNGTWDCGFTGLNSRTQYTATGFSKPIKIVFRLLYRPSRKIEVKGSLKYHPESIEYSTTSESIFETHLYHPLYQKVKMISRQAKFRIQTGSIHSYLLYIFCVVVILMAYNSIV